MDDNEISAYEMFAYIASLPEPKRSRVIAVVEYLLGHAQIAERMLESEATLVAILAESPVTQPLPSVN